MSPETLASTNRIPCAGQAPQPGPGDPCSSWYRHRRQYHGALRALPSGQASAGSGHPQKPWITRCAAATGPTTPEDRQSPRKNAPTLRGTQTSPRAPALGQPDGPAGLSRLTRSATRICRTTSNRLSPPNMLHPPGPRTPLPACRGIRKRQPPCRAPHHTCDGGHSVCGNPVHIPPVGGIPHSEIRSAPPEIE